MTSPSAAPAPGVAPTLPDVNIFVSFKPGKVTEDGATTMVELAFLDTPGNSMNDLANAIPHIKTAVGSGVFHKEIHNAIAKVFGIKPKIRKISVGIKEIETWDVNKCEEHIRSLVHSFTLHYTRNQVPEALYNECTNFMTKISFSHDYVLDPQDTVRCKQATANFARRWDFGEQARSEDFEYMCVNACEAKYGRNAPKCNLYSGDDLVSQLKHTGDGLGR